MNGLLSIPVGIELSLWSESESITSISTSSVSPGLCFSPSPLAVS